MKNELLLELMVDKLNQDIKYLDKLPVEYFTDSIIKRALVHDYRLITKIPKSLRNDDVVTLALFLGASVKDLDADDINFRTSFVACVCDWKNFYLLPENHRHPINFVAACLNRNDLQDFDIIDDPEYIKDVNLCFNIFSKVLDSDFSKKYIKIKGA